MMPILISQIISLWRIITVSSGPSNNDRILLGARVRHYLDIGKKLYAKYPNAILMTSEVGGLGYTFKGTIVDGAGIISPSALKYHPMPVPEARSYPSIGAIPVEFIEEVKPDIIVSYDVFIETFLKSSIIHKYHHIKYPAFLPEDMQKIAVKEIWDSYNLNVFLNKESFRQCE